MTVQSQPLPLHRRGFEHVFVATDFSAGAADATGRTALLPLAEGGRITVFHALPEGLPGKLLPLAEQAARQQLEQAAATLSGSMASGGRSGVQVEPKLGCGRPYVEIIRHARAAGANLIVLGRHGRRPVKDMFIGSTAQRVVHSGDLPVLVVSGEAKRAYRRPLVAVDLEDTSRAVVALALDVLGPEVKSATMVHAYHVPFEGFLTAGVSPEQAAGLREEYRQVAVSGLARLQASLGELEVRWQTSVLEGDPRAEIVREALRRRADLLGVGTHGRSGLAHALIGSVAEWILQAAPCDVLIARPARVSFELP